MGIFCPEHNFKTLRKIDFNVYVVKGWLSVEKKSKTRNSTFVIFYIIVPFCPEQVSKTVRDIDFNSSVVDR